MDYRISDHARKQMADRGISENMLDNVMQAPEQVLPAKKGRRAYQSRIVLRGRQFLLRAFVVERTTPHIVASIYFTSRISRYWQP